MKLEVAKKESTFNPVKLTIVLESQEEFNTLVAICGFNATVTTAVQKMPLPGNLFNKNLSEEILGLIYRKLMTVEGV